MAKVIYHGPGDTVELDGIVVEKGKARELTNEQVTRLRASDGRAAVEVVEQGRESELDRLRIVDAQDRERESAAVDRERDERKTADERAKFERASADRATKAAKERDELRATAASGIAKKGGS